MSVLVIGVPVLVGLVFVAAVLIYCVARHAYGRVATKAEIDSASSDTISKM